MAVLWKLEPQKRGAWHFHAIAWGLPYMPGADLLQLWREVTGDDTITQIKIEPLATARKARSYVAKYVGKVITCDLSRVALAILLKQPAWYIFALALDYLPNLPAATKPGRFWGIEHRALINWAVLEIVSLVSSGAFFDIKRAARRKWQGINGNKHQGFTLYVHDPTQWLDYFYYLQRKDKQHEY
jgi:hypothetical protein